MGTFMKIVFHTFMTCITGGLWLLGVLAYYLLKK